MIHSTGALASPLDTRDVVASFDMKEEIPDEVHSDIDETVAYIYQKQVGACTACALVKIIEYIYYKKTGTYTKLSARFLYNITKKYIDFNLYEGSSLRSALKAAQKYGVMTEKDCPSNFELSHLAFLNLDITPDMLLKASKWRIGVYYSVPVEKSLIHYGIRRFGALYARFEVGNKWYTPTWFAKDILPLQSSGLIDSGHAVVVYRSNIKTMVQWLLNSWSRLWGDNGNGNYNYDNYKPTELWGVTLDPVQTATIDKSPVIEDGTWRKFMQILRDLKVIK